ncbi:RagB/SusD family nutrient uptake outer membrane protein [Pedobacter sp. PAMC26386]|nr:RagB/SusD family nutrient uptake outer membrane protein [Pedobacter sp. PAMC26386]
MKNIIKSGLILAVTAVLLTSCDKRGFLAPPPLTNALDKEKTFTDPVNTDKFLANCYNGLTGGLDDFGNGQNYALISDEAEAGPAYLATNGVNFGSVDASNNLDNAYGGLYTYIRRTNVLLSNRELMNGFDKTIKDKFVAEAQFLRAFFYSELIKRYAGIPIVTSPVAFEDLKDAAAQAKYKANLKRATYAESVDFVVKQLDSAAAILPWAVTSDSDRGRATAAACVALKAKVLLYAASKLFNNNQPAAGNEPGNSSNPVTGYPNYDVNRWKLAADACREFLTKNQANSNWYYLYTGGYDKLFTESRDASNHELIWYRQGTSNSAIYCNPAGRLGGYAHSQTLLNLVDKYEMTNGKQKDEAGSGYDEQQWWVKRDPRLGMSFVRDGDTYKGVTLEFWPGGKDYNDTHRTAIFFRKFQRADENTGLQKWHYIRMADIYLMLAEAENEVSGPTAEVYTNINLIRSRTGVGMPGIAPGLNQQQMRDKIRNERAVEFAFEAQRYFDERRWMIAEQTENAPVYGFKVSKSGNVITHTRYLIENRIFKKRMYLTPIPVVEIYKGASIEQNPGY